MCPHARQAASSPREHARCGWRALTSSVLALANASAVDEVLQAGRHSSVEHHACCCAAMQQRRGLDVLCVRQAGTAQQVAMHVRSPGCTWSCSGKCRRSSAWHVRRDKCIQSATVCPASWRTANRPEPASAPAPHLVNDALHVGDVAACLRQPRVCSSNNRSLSSGRSG